VRWLAPHAFQPTTTIEKDRSGWVSPRDNGALEYSLNRKMLLTYRAEMKLLPPSVIT
jgi:recombination associated protein RdgC